MRDDLRATLAELMAKGLLVRHITPEGDAYGLDPDLAPNISAWMHGHPDERQGLIEESVSAAIGDHYAADFQRNADSDDADAAEQAALDAKNTIASFVEGRSFRELDAFAERLVSGTRDPELISQVLDELRAAGVHVPFAGYRLRRLIGVGWWSAVYEGERADNGLPVAVKILRSAWGDDETEVLRFVDEATVGNRVRHPDVVDIFDAGQHNGSRYLVSELLRGRSLERRWRSKSRRLPLKRVLEIAMHVLGVLAAAHEKSILHGGIRPSNIFITNDGAVKLLDFGIQNLVRGAERGQSFHEEPEPTLFLAPEQLRDELPDPRTDLWSLGSTMLALLSGKPADAKNPRHIDADPNEVPFDIAAVLERALKPSRDERFQTAQQMWEAIAAIHAVLLDESEPTSEPGRGSQPVVATYPAGPLSERIEFDGQPAERQPIPSQRDALPTPSKRSVSVPPPPPDSTPPRVSEPPISRPPPESPSGPRPIVPVQITPEEAPATDSQVRPVHPDEASKYLVQVPKPFSNLDKLLWIALPVLVLSVLGTALVFWIIDWPKTVLEKADAAAPPPTLPTYPGPPACADGVKNGAETDVDCGGSQCPPCAHHGACRSGADCRSFVCAGGACVPCRAASDCPRGMSCQQGACVWLASDAGEPDLGVGEDASPDGSEPELDASTTLPPGEGDAASTLDANGTACTSAETCASGFCVDGVCCNNACTGTCVACNLRTFTGMCAEIPFGYDPDKECGRKVCDGDGACGDRKINGKRCKAGRECKSGFCWRGICCNTDCRGADGDCSTGSCKRKLLIE